MSLDTENPEFERAHAAGMAPAYFAAAMPDAPALVSRYGARSFAELNGIAWDETNRRLFVTGKNWPNLFEVRF